jgi:DNA gyrase/topoisomerase IV subunit A
MARETKDEQLQNSEETDWKAKSDEMQARIAQLEQGIASRDSELTAIKQSLSGTVAKYRVAVLANAPGVPEELIKGKSIDEIDASLELARGIVSKVRQQLEVEAEANRVPAGAPPRMPQDLSALSPAEKIAYALSRQAK